MRRGLGGTDVGPVISFYRPELAATCAKYANATDVALRLIHGIERPRNKAMSRGIDAEPRLRKVYVESCLGPGRMLEPHPTPWIVAHEAHPWATCSPDDVVIEDGVGEVCLVEYKSTSIFGRNKWGDEGSDQIPDLYNLQVQWCCEILDLPRWEVVAGFGRDFEDEHGNHQFLYEKTALFRGERDRDLAAMCLDLCGRFVREFIEPRKLPPLTPVNNRRAYSQLLKGETWTPQATEAS
jgi:hypothetical protein